MAMTDPTPEGATLEEKVAIRREAWGDYLNSFDDRAEMLAQLDKANLAWGDVKDGQTVYESPTIAHRETIVSVDDRVGGTRPMVQSPYRFSVSESGVKGPAAHRGEHNRDVLWEWLKLPADEITALENSGALIAEDTETDEAT